MLSLCPECLGVTACSGNPSTYMRWCKCGAPSYEELQSRIATALAAFREIWPDEPQHEAAKRVLAALEGTDQ